MEDGASWPASKFVPAEEYACYKRGFHLKELFLMPTMFGYVAMFACAECGVVFGY